MPSTMTEALIVPSGSGESVPLPHGAFGLLADAADTGGALGANLLTLDVGADGAQPHYHSRSAELFYVVAGVAEFYLDARSETLPAGSLVVVPPAMPHAFGAAPDSTAELFVVSSPGIQRFEYFRHLARIQHGVESVDSLLPEQDRYDVHFLPGISWRQSRSGEDGVSR
ncbi:cupin domain-containing protein [Nocardia cyriacigeorgica]|uniref:cupin domain-containing protein n=1 Tax=Nocardia cyriacigeorgica TaxID=135487 RepID=UPI0024580D7A|nr:cupin domain-containing protein [Nocardia cyriacigeorgica]